MRFEDYDPWAVDWAYFGPESSRTTPPISGVRFAEGTPAMVRNDVPTTPPMPILRMTLWMGTTPENGGEAPIFNGPREYDGVTWYPFTVLSSVGYSGAIADLGDGRFRVSFDGMPWPDEDGEVWNDGVEEMRPEDVPAHP